jgi:hypothetical protein
MDAASHQIAKTSHEGYVGGNPLVSKTRLSVYGSNR